MKIFNYFVQSFFVYIFFIVGKIVGLSFSRKIFSRLFCFLGPIFKSKKILENNLHTFKKDISDNKKKEIIFKMWNNYGSTFIEYIFLNYFRKNNSHISFIGEEKLNKIISKGKPVIFISGHFANFELMSMEITKKNIKLATIYRPLNNIFLNPFMEFIRKKYVCQNQVKKGIHGLKDAVNYIKNGFSLALMVDQRLGEGEKVKFFNKLASTTTLPAQLAIKYQLSIVPVFIERTDKNNFIIEFFDEVKGSNFKDKLDLTEKLNVIIEGMIIRNPNQWIWTHNRWK